MLSSEMDDDDVERQPLLRLCLNQSAVRGTICKGIGHKAYHVYLRLKNRSIFACVVLSVKDLERSKSMPNEVIGFWWSAVDDIWPDFNVKLAVERWCCANFPDIKIPKFKLRRYKD